jgi:stage V sporulation protein AA
MCEPLYFSLRETAAASTDGIRLSDVCAVQGVTEGPLADVRIPVSGTVTKVSALWVAGTLRALCPDRMPLSVGAAECRIFLREKPPGKVSVLLKTVLLAVVMFFGGAVAIMTFHEDVNMRAVLGDIYALFTGEAAQSSPIVSVPYSIGIVAGFVVLLGLVHRRKHKPTLLELSAHEQEKEQRSFMADKEDGG